MKFTTNDIKVLREKTGAGVVECKNALVIHDGNLTLAEKALIEKLGQKAEKKMMKAYQKSLHQWQKYL